MTRGHLQAILSAYPDLISRVRLLSPDHLDISDPYGGGFDEYSACKLSIEQSLLALIDQLLLTDDRF